MAQLLIQIVSMSVVNVLAFWKKKVMPPMALANGLWVGIAPKELSDLTFVERLLIARVRSNHCIVHVLKGGWKMRANAIMFPSPVPKVCNILPPPNWMKSLHLCSLVLPNPLQRI